jgi:hypothetical protein
VTITKGYATYPPNLSVTIVVTYATDYRRILFSAPRPSLTPVSGNRASSGLDKLSSDVIGR